MNKYKQTIIRILAIIAVILWISTSFCSAWLVATSQSYYHAKTVNINISGDYDDSSIEIHIDSDNINVSPESNNRSELLQELITAIISTIVTGSSASTLTFIVFKKK